jgi:hypothetical protein
MKPLIHAKISVKKFGGKVEDYLPIHEWFDHTKAHIADMRHRAVLHNSFGIYLCQQIYGIYFKNSDGHDVSVRDVGEQHVLDDLGHIPSLDECFKSLPLEAWFGGRVRSVKTVRAKDIGAFNIVD